jgi:L-threonylcarbamoyladenylate synthase
VLATAGLDTLALRLPRHPVAAALLQSFGGPIAAPSANPSGRLSPTTAAHVAESLGDKVAAILDGGPAAVGLESTIVDLSRPQAQLLRPGGLPVEEIEALIGPLAAPDDAEGPRAPGMLASHYAPDLPLRLNATEVGPTDALLAFGAHPLTGARACLNLSVTGDLTEAAANLFAHMRRLDAGSAHTIAVMPIPEHGLGRGINDRLRRAAAPRAVN